MHCVYSIRNKCNSWRQSCAISKTPCLLLHVMTNIFIPIHLSDNKITMNIS